MCVCLLSQRTAPNGPPGENSANLRGAFRCACALRIGRRATEIKTSVPEGATIGAVTVTDFW